MSSPERCVPATRRQATATASQTESHITLKGSVETVAELTFLRGIGVYLFQGYLLARPAYEQIPDVDWSKVPA